MANLAFSAPVMAGSSTACSAMFAPSSLSSLSSFSSRYASLPVSSRAFSLAPSMYKERCGREFGGARALYASKEGEGMGRRGSIAAMTFALATTFLLPLEDANADTCARKECQPKPNFLPEGSLPDKSEIVSMPALKGKDYGKTKMKYPDFVATPSGLQYKDVKVGNGESPEDGDRVVFDWEGYTIGYYGRIFQAKNGVKGGAFADETDFQRCILGSHTVIPGLEEGLKGMKVGGIRQLVVTPELGYPEDDPAHTRVGPKPSTFDGQRALNFVLFNKGLIDKTLLFNIKVIRIDKRDSDGNYIRKGS